MSERPDAGELLELSTLRATRTMLEDADTLALQSIAASLIRLNAILAPTMLQQLESTPVPAAWEASDLTAQDAIPTPCTHPDIDCERSGGLATCRCLPPLDIRPGDQAQSPQTGRAMPEADQAGTGSQSTE